MSKVLNKMAKFFALLGAYALAFLECYCFAILIIGMLISVVCAIITAFAPLTGWMVDKYWAVLLLASLPFGIIFFILVIKHKDENKDK